MEIISKFNTGLEISLEFLFFIDASFQGTIIMLKYFGLIDKVLIWSDKEQPVLSRELKLDWKRVSFGQSIGSCHGLRTPSEEIPFTAQPKINSHSQIFWYGQSIFCLPHRPKFSDFFDLCLHWV